MVMTVKMGLVGLLEGGIVRTPSVVLCIHSNKEHNVLDFKFLEGSISLPSQGLRWNMFA